LTFNWNAVRRYFSIIFLCLHWIYCLD
jgi:hypothetical protein